MTYRGWGVFTVLLSALVLGAVFIVSQRGADAQGPEGTDQTPDLRLVDLHDAGPSPDVSEEGTNSPLSQGAGSAAGDIGAAAVGSSFSYQGRLLDGGQPADGAYDMRFSLHSAADGGAQVGGTITNGSVPVAAGLFTVVLNFGSSAFTGDSRYLEIAVRPGGSLDAFSVLSPRRALTPTPYAVYAANAGQLDGMDAADFAASSHTHDDRYYQKRSATFFTGSLDAGQSATWSTHSWPTDEIVYWSIHPTTSGGRVDWSVDVELAASNTHKFYITITNRSAATTSFAAKYVRFR